MQDRDLGQNCRPLSRWLSSRRHQSPSGAALENNDPAEARRPLTESPQRQIQKSLSGIDGWLPALFGPCRLAPVRTQDHQANIFNITPIDTDSMMWWAMRIVDRGRALIRHVDISQ